MIDGVYSGEMTMTVEDGLSLQLAIERLDTFRDLWSQAAAFSAALPPEARDIVYRKSADVETALAELVPVLGGLHPDVIALVSQTLDGFHSVLTKVADWYDGSGHVPADVTETLVDLNQRVGALETMIRGVGAALKSIGAGPIVRSG